MPAKNGFTARGGIISDTPLIPNQARIKGTHARGGIGRSISIVESKKRSAAEKCPIVNPRGIAIPVAKRKAIMTLAKLMMVLSIKLPVINIFAHGSDRTPATASNLGKTVGLSRHTAINCQRLMRKSGKTA